MTRPLQTLWALLTSVAIVLTGCSPHQPFYVNEDGDLSHYLNVATEIDYPDVCTKSLEEVDGACPPITLDNDKDFQFWNVALEEVVNLALVNSKVMRSLGGRFASSAFNPRSQVGEAPDALLTGPDRITTVYDPAITETAPFVGVESALAAFDAQFSSNLFWEKNDRPQNVNAGGLFGGFFTPVFEQDDSTFNAQVSKVTATGGTFTMRNNIFYDLNNNPTRQIPSDYNVNFEASFAQPLLAGAGAQFNRIAGPQNPFTGVGTPAFDGVMLARINTDISLADFEAGVRNLVSDTEDAYWELYFAYRNLEASKTGRKSALQTWRKVHALFEQGAKGGEAAQEAQAREQYFLFRGQVQTALHDLHRAEQRLRYIIGLAVADGRLMRPCDEPTTAEVKFDWCEIHCEGLARSVELRRQKWRIKERELELIAARNLLQPRLDVVGRYRWLGLGDDLVQADRNPEGGGLDGTNAFQSLTGGDFQEWQVGLQTTWNIGFRRELSTVRHFQLQLARERARLEDQELEVSHELGDAIGNLDFNYNFTVTNFNRRVAADKQVQAIQAAYEADTVTLDLLLDAQRRRADAEIAFYRSLVDYNRGIKQVHYRKGSLLEYNGVYLTEGPWPAKALFDAHRLARQRDASYYLNYGFTRPRVISEGCYEQQTGMHGTGGQIPVDSQGGDVIPGDAEEVPTPAPARRSVMERSEPELGKVSQPRLITPTAAALPIKQATAKHEPKKPQAAGKVSQAAAFAWGSLGLGGESTTQAGETSGQAKAKTPSQRKSAAATSSGLTKLSGSVALRQTPRTADSGLKTAAVESSRAVADNTSGSATSDVDRGHVAPVAYQWKSSSSNEPVEDRAAGTSDRAASGWKGPKR